MAIEKNNNEFRITKARYERFADFLCVLRAMAGVSQEQVAYTLGISRQTYIELEGKKRPITRKNFLLLLLYFDYHAKTHDFLRQFDLFPVELVQQINSLEGSSGD